MAMVRGPAAGSAANTAILDHAEKRDAGIVAGDRQGPGPEADDPDPGYV